MSSSTIFVAGVVGRFGLWICGLEGRFFPKWTSGCELTATGNRPIGKSIPSFGPEIILNNTDFYKYF
jgi:hypothetical protein